MYDIKHLNVMQLFMKILAETEYSTVSALYYEDYNTGPRFLAYVIEDGFRNPKVPGLTRIPGGKYLIKKRFEGKHYRSYSKRFNHTHTYQLMNVPNFEYIMIHIGNTPKDTEGCLLVNNGTRYDDMTDQHIGIDSTNAYRELYLFLNNAFKEHDIITIDIIRKVNFL